MKPRKHGQKWEVSYRCPNYPKVISESFNSIEEAELRIAQINLEKKQGKLLPPAEKLDPDRNSAQFKHRVTVAQLMNEFIAVYGKVKWAGNTASNNRSRIKYYILPHLGQVRLKDLSAHRLTRFYTSLLGQPTIPKAGQPQGTVTACVVQEVHKILRCALNQAIRWNWLDGSNPAEGATVPSYKRKERETLSERDLQHAIISCENPILKLCMCLSIGCSLRIGEILGLTWDNIHIDPDLIESGDAYLHIGKQLQRLKKSDIAAMTLQDSRSILFVFPDCVQNCRTSLVLTKPKTDTSSRDNYIPRSIALLLSQHREHQKKEKLLLGSTYHDYNLVIAQENGRPYERSMIGSLLNTLEVEQGFKQVVFHSFRHSSTSLKLKISGGDIKAVQGDTGHAQATMVTDVYSHISTADRKRITLGMESFFSATQATTTTAPPPESTDIGKINELLRENPEKAEKLLKLLELLT